jgi:cell surface protein SprA
LRRTHKYVFTAGIVSAFLSVVLGTNIKGRSGFLAHPFLQSDSAKKDTAAPKLKYPFKDRRNDKISSKSSNSPFFLKDPSNVKSTIEYNPETGNYDISEKIGNQFYRSPSSMSYDDYVKQESEKATKNYWKQRTNEDNVLKKKGIIPKLHVGGEAFDRIFGGNTIDIRPQGSAELIFGGNTNYTQNPALTIQQRTISAFDFKEKIQMNVVGNIGEKLKLTTNYNTEATFDFENQMKLEYTGYPDEIIKKIEAGNVSFPLPGSLITGSQSLFGIKTQLQFGRLNVTSVFSQKKGKSSVVEVSGGSQTNVFTINGDQYENNKHYFLAQYFRDAYDGALSNLPVVNSRIIISKIEVWMTNANSDPNTRSILALTDLGESRRIGGGNGFVTPVGSSALPDNAANTLYPNITAKGMPYDSLRSIKHAENILSAEGKLANAFDYEILSNARRVNPSEYTLNPKLGYISLNFTLMPNQALAVAFQYTILGEQGTHQVGEFSTDGVAPPSILYLKLLKSHVTNTHSPLWDLMMKNIYSLGGAYQISAKDFKLDVLYANPSTGAPLQYLPDGPANIKGTRLIKLLNLDNLNTQNLKQPDGIFDFIDGITINATNGRLIFPVVEPFGSHLHAVFNGDPSVSKFAYDSLYRSTKAAAQQDASHNRYSMKGSYQSTSTSDISLNAPNIPKNSVTVTAGGIKLIEDQDYSVDYISGRVKILNAGIQNSGQPIKISLESNALFNIQTKSLIGSRFEYAFSKNFNLGGTVMNMTERPLTQKVNIGDEPVSNTILGFDGNYKSESRFLTKMIDKLPFISTKEVSSITASGEVAYLIPGHSSAIGNSGTSYIDDFEGSKTPIDMKSPNAWYLASTPQKQPLLFPEATDATRKTGLELEYGFNRAKLAWHVIDNVFLNPDNTNTPPNIVNDKDAQSDPYVRAVVEQEIFPNKQATNGVQATLQVLNLAYYPKERGPYNFDVKGVPGISRGINADGSLIAPATRWGGIMRKIETNDFEAGNVETIEFWLMDPFIKDTLNQSTGGQLYFNLGNISEDILRDSRELAENGLPGTANANTFDNTAWGRVPKVLPPVNAFDNDPSARALQDVGLDGMGDEDERSWFKDRYLDKIAAAFGPSAAYSNALNDPSGDNYHYFRGDDYDAQNKKILERYKEFNNTQGNSSVNAGAYPTSATNMPDAEDVNRDNNMNDTEDYFQYRVNIVPNKMRIGQNFITDILDAEYTGANAQKKKVKWYHFKIPVQSYEQAFGNIQDFRSIGWIRMFLKGFDKEIVCRFGKLQMVRGEWRRYNNSLLGPGEYIPGGDDKLPFDVTTVNLEENGNRSPIPYVIPPGIQRQIDIATTNLRKLNEQSLALRICNLADGDARSAYKSVQYDMRNYKKLRMFIHGESLNSEVLRKGDVSVFLRLGSDFTDNYYEYEIPLTPTRAGATSPDEIWPAANDLELDFSWLQKVKEARNNAMLVQGSGVTLFNPYQPFLDDKGNKVTIKGTPNLAAVRTIMIGVRNPKKLSNSDSDDGKEKCVEVWVNELRLTDFDQYGGWAANARVTAKLADLGSLSLAASKSTPGFGNVEQKLNDRSKIDQTQYDISSNVELGKFLPLKSRVSVPMYVGLSESFGTPLFNPLDQDVRLKDALANAARVSDSAKKALTNASVDYTLRRSINFTNVKRDRAPEKLKSMPYDIENFSATYAYAEIFKSNFATEYNVVKTYKGGLSYNYTLVPKNITPFAKYDFINKYEYLKVVKDFNFNVLPSNFSFRADVDRQFASTQLRSYSDGAFVRIDPTYTKSFNFMRTYDYKQDFTKSLKFEFGARNDSRLDETTGDINKAAIYDSLKSRNYLGRTVQYHHTANFNYALPINKIPITDWITASTRYGVVYDWTAAPLKGDSMGNVIQNSNNIQHTANFAMATLYNKSKFLKELAQPKPVVPKLKPLPKLPKNPKDTALKAVKDTIKEESIFKPLFELLGKGILSFKTASFTYAETNGTMLPGFRPKSQILGEDLNNNMAPGTGFVFGSQADIRPAAVSNNWLVKNPYLSTLYTTTNSKNLNLRASIEPIQSLRIELTGTRSISNNHTENFMFDKSHGEFTSFNPQETGNFSISYNTFSTAFFSDDKNYSSITFQQFRANRFSIAERLGQANEHSHGRSALNGYANGYGPASQEVLIPAFLAAYGGGSVKTVELNPFPTIPKPNWRITYDGLSKYDWAKKYFSSITLGHSYRSTYTISSFNTDLRYDQSQAQPTVLNKDQNFVSKFNITQISISEQFGPLLSIDITWKNSLSTRMEVKKDRSISMSFSGNQLTEIKGNEYVIGAGYKIKELNLPFKVFGNNIKLKNDLNLRADLSVRNNTTVIRKVIENIEQATAGSIIISIKISVDYIVNERFSIRLFYDRIMTTPVVSSSFQTANTNFGVSVRFTLAQ